MASDQIIVFWAVEPLFLLVANNWIIETLAMCLAGTNDRFAALLHCFRCLWRRTSNRRRGREAHQRAPYWLSGHSAYAVAAWASCKSGGINASL